MFKQDEFSELTDRSLEVTASMMHVEEKLSAAEKNDRLDDLRRIAVRKLLLSFFNKIKAAESISEIKRINSETEAEFERLCKLEDMYELIDDNCRLSNIARSSKVIVINKSISSDLEKIHLENYRENKNAVHAGGHETATCETP